MNKQNVITLDGLPHDDSKFVSEAADSFIGIGEWYWVKSNGSHWCEKTGKRIDGEYEWLGCAMEIGSNYALMNEPEEDGCGYITSRIHFDNVFAKLRHEPNVERVIKERISYFQEKAKQHLAEVKDITARLGVSKQLKLSNAPIAEAGTGLMAMSGQHDIKEYEASLVRAEKEELPALFEAIKKASSKVAKWMGAEMLPMKAQTRIMKGSIGEIKDRIFNVSLYAGLIEHIVQCKKGEPAAFAEKLHVMQRLLFMDEECLLNYRVGGMEFNDIGAFDEWIAEPDNFERILPFQRCMVAMRVRRHKKDRDWQGSIKILMNNIQNARSDKWTYLYIRNGENLYRLGSDSFEFDGASDLIFPDKAIFNPSEPMMVKDESFGKFAMISVSDFELRCKEQKEKEENFYQWNKNHPLDTWKDYDPKEEKHGEPRIKWLWEQSNPYRNWNSYGIRFVPSEWHPFNDSYVYYDDCVKQMADRIKKYNRIALLIQGLFDRSEILHPHPPVKTWEPEGFGAAIELVYDGSLVLHSGAEPDIEAYISGCNASLGADSVVIGQEDYWMEKEAEKECARRDKDWRDKSEYRPERFTPYGNNGPGYVAKMASLKNRSGKAVFTWNRERRTSDYYAGKQHGDPIRASITVPVSRLFNVSAYTPGDFKQFFRDPRTRAKYLMWAPMLIAAEEYWAGNAIAQEPVGMED